MRPLGDLIGTLVHTAAVADNPSARSRGWISRTWSTILFYLSEGAVQIIFVDFEICVYFLQEKPP